MTPAITVTDRKIVTHPSGSDGFESVGWTKDRQREAHLKSFRTELVRKQRLKAERERSDDVIVKQTQVERKTLTSDYEEQEDATRECKPGNKRLSTIRGFKLDWSKAPF